MVDSFDPGVKAGNPQDSSESDRSARMMLEGFRGPLTGKVSASGESGGILGEKALAAEDMKIVHAAIPQGQGETDTCFCEFVERRLEAAVYLGFRHAGVQ